MLPGFFVSMLFLHGNQREMVLPQSEQKNNASSTLLRHNSFEARLQDRHSQLPAAVLRAAGTEEATFLAGRKEETLTGFRF